MPQFCAAFGCSNSSYKDSCRTFCVSFHRFPLADKILLRQWLYNVRRENFEPTENTRLCSDHFEKDCFEYQNFTNKRLLKKNSVPTLFSFIEQKKKRKCTSYSFGNEESSVESKQNENADNLKKKPGSKKKKILSEEITSDEVSNSPVLSNQTPCFNLLDEKDKSECVPAVTIKVEEPWNQESTFTPKPIEDNSQVRDKLQIEIKEVRSVSSSFSAEAADVNKAEIAKTSSQIFQVADENKTEISKASSHFARPLGALEREKIFVTLVASELSDLSVNPELYLKTKRAILDILIQSHFELINCNS